MNKTAGEKLKEIIPQTTYVADERYRQEAINKILEIIEQERERAFNEGREHIRKSRPVGKIGVTIFGYKYESLEEYKQQNPLS